MSTKNKNNPFETLMPKRILDDAEQEQGINRYHKSIVDHKMREQYIANEAAMQPITQRLDKIIYLLEIILDKLQ